MLRIGLVAFVLVGMTLPVLAGGKAEGKVKGGYVHVVIFTMKKDTTRTEVDEVIKDCHKMLAKIKTVRSVKVGRPAAEATPKYARKDYDLALLILVDDFASLKSYLDDPLHVEFVKKHEKHFDMEKLKVFDFIDRK